jgi:hypothetical protein
MPTKSKPEEQSERFRQTARDLGCDESGEAFERAFGKIVPPKRPKPTKEPEPECKKPRK